MLLSMLTPYAEDIIWIINVDFDATVQLLIYFMFFKYLRKNGNTTKQCIIYIQTSRKPMMREVLYNILIEFCIPMKLARLIKICMNENYNRVRAGKHLSDMFPVRNGLKNEDGLSPLFFNFALEHTIRRVQVNQDDLKLSGTHQLPVYADDVNILGGNIHTTKKTQTL